MRWFEADLHVHTVLSPCASREMTPPAIVAAAACKRLSMIAVCDHNSAGNVAAVADAAAGTLAVIAGIEVATCEEIHVVGLFPGTGEAEAAGAEIRETLPEAGADAGRAFGEQTIADAAGNAVGREDRLLAAASAFDLRGAIALIRRHEGIAVAAHADRPSFSVFSQLGSAPPDCRFDAVEVSLKPANRDMLPRVEALGLPIIASSDAHFLGDIGSHRTFLEARSPSFRELSLALRGTGGRRCGYA